MFPEKAKKLIEERKVYGNYRELKIYDYKVDFFSNDYLGIAKKIGCFRTTQSHSGSTGSRLISGNSVFCEKVERFLANFYNAEASLIFNSGYTRQIWRFYHPFLSGEMLFCMTNLFMLLCEMA